MTNLKKAVSVIWISLVAVCFQNCSSGFTTSETFLMGAQNGRRADMALASRGLHFPNQHAGTGVFIPGGEGEGVNTMMVSQSLYGKYGRCPNCPDWIGGMSMNLVRQSLGMIKGTSLNHFREIVEASAFFPAPNQLARVNDLVEILQIYQAQNASIMLSLGTPIPSWMNPELAAKNAISYQPNGAGLYEGGRICFLPQSDVVWEQLKNNMAQSLGLLGKALWDDPRLDRNWMRDNLTFDPINEFDSFVAGPDCRHDQRHLYATGKRAASLTGGIQYVFNSYGLPFIVTMPSGATGTIQYFADFYASGGQAQANVHAYFRANGKSPSDPTRNTDYANFLVQYLTQVNNVIPEPYKNQIILGEFGNYLTENDACTVNAPGDCAGLLQTGPALEKYLFTILNDSRIKKLAPLRMVWQLTDSAPTNTSDVSQLTSGLIRVDGTPKSSLYHYLLQRDGIYLSADKTRLQSLRARATKVLGPVTEVTLSTFLKDWIYQLDSWDALVARYQYTAPPTSPCDSLALASQTVAQRNICQAYRDLFGRPAETGALTYWIPEIGNRSLACIKKALALGTGATDCAAFRTRIGVAAPSVACGGSASDPIVSFGCI